MSRKSGYNGIKYRLVVSQNDLKVEMMMVVVVVVVTVVIVK